MAVLIVLMDCWRLNACLRRQRCTGQYGQVLESKLILARDLLDKERNFETYGAAIAWDVEPPCARSYD